MATPQMRQPTNTRRIRNSAVRYVSTPRWVASYEGSPVSGLREGRRRVGLLVPRHSSNDPSGRSFIAYDPDGKVREHPIGYLPSGSHGAWWTAHANELPPEQWRAIRAFYNQLLTEQTT